MAAPQRVGVLQPVPRLRVAAYGVAGSVRRLASLAALVWLLVLLSPVGSGGMVEVPLALSVSVLRSLLGSGSIFPPPFRTRTPSITIAATLRDGDERPIEMHAPPIETPQSDELKPA